MYLFRDLASDKSGFEVFLDTRKLDIGIDFMDDIRQAISETDVFILLYSETYMTKPFTQKEFYTALTAGIGVILLYEGSDETFRKDRLCPKGLPTLFYTRDSDGNIPHRKLEELVNMMNIERQYFKERKMRRFLRLTKNLKMSSMYSWININNEINEPEFVYPLYCLPSSLDLQRIEDGITDNKGKHIIIYDHWPIPEFYNSNIRWIMKDKNITLKTLQECFIPNVQINNNNTEMTGKKPIVFLSASIPDGKNEHDYIFADIHEIIVTLVEEIINRKGKLVFGGHPTITPIIANMMNLYKQKNNGCYPDITLYQSAYFENQFPPEVNEFPEARRKIIEKCNNLDESLTLMRKRILNDEFFTHAVFIGGNIKEDGTCGVWTECEIFHAKYPKAKCIAFNNTGTDLNRIEAIAKNMFINPNTIDEFVHLFD